MSFPFTRVADEADSRVEFRLQVERCAEHEPEERDARVNLDGGVPSVRARERRFHTARRASRAHRGAPGGLLTSGELR
jgi:hypothetical protein